ncbi:kinase-like domain-containing protein [Aspergillus varians]
MVYTSQLSPPSGSLVGTISICDPKTRESSKPMTIYSRQEIYVGRDPRKCQYVVNDPFVSNKHLWIYTVIFDQDNPGEVAPLVYAQDISTNGSLWNEYRMGNGRSSFLLSDGDILQLSAGTFLRYSSVGGAQAKGFTILQALEMKSFDHEYVITRRKLGSGAYGQVHMAYKRSTGQQFACKIVDLLAVKHRLAKEGEARHEQAYNKTISSKMRYRYVKFQLQAKLEQYHREAKILETLQHPNIIGLEKVIKSGNTIYMLQDLLTAGDLFSYIQYKGGKLPDIEAAVIVRQIVIAIDYLHGKNIVHRDLKPDNILMTSRADGCRVVLTDFGCATSVDPISNRMSTMVGTFEFSAPEVVRQNDKGYTKAADLWSLGCLTAVLLTGEPLFDNLPKGSESNFHRLAAIKNLKVKMDRHKVGERAQDFAFQLLQHEVSQRLDAKQALRHGWFTNASHKSDFEALYQRSIRDWKPRSAKEPRIVGLDLYFEDDQNSSVSRIESTQDNHDPSVKTEICSQSLPTSLSLTCKTDEERSSGIRRLPSENLSDLVLPPHVNITTKNRPSRSAPKCGSGAGTTLAIGDQTLREGISHCPSSIKCNPPRGYTSSPAVEPPPSPSNSLKIQALVEEVVSGAQPGRSTTRAKRRRRSSMDGSEDEVYEEFRNPVTGKRQHLIYGACARKGL